MGAILTVAAMLLVTTAGLLPALGGARLAFLAAERISTWPGALATEVAAIIVLLTSLRAVAKLLSGEATPAAVAAPAVLGIVSLMLAAVFPAAWTSVNHPNDFTTSRSFLQLSFWASVSAALVAGVAIMSWQRSDRFSGRVLSYLLGAVVNGASVVVALLALLALTPALLGTSATFQCVCLIGWSAFAHVVHQELAVAVWWPYGVRPSSVMKGVVQAAFSRVGHSEPQILFLGGVLAETAECELRWRAAGRSCLVISSTLAQRLTIEELEAVCLHEAAHLKLGHLPARTGVAFLGGALTIVALAGVVMLLPRVVHRWAIPVSVAGVFLLRQLVLAWQSRRQEDEADEAVKRAFMGTLLASALGKLHGDSATNAEVPLAVWEGHRSIEDRIENLSAREARL